MSKDYEYFTQLKYDLIIKNDVNIFSHSKSQVQVRKNRIEGYVFVWMSQHQNDNCTHTIEFFFLNLYHILVVMNILKFVYFSLISQTFLLYLYLTFNKFSTSHI